MRAADVQLLQNNVYVRLVVGAVVQVPSSVQPLSKVVVGELDQNDGKIAVALLDREVRHRRLRKICFLPIWLHTLVSWLGGYVVANVSEFWF